MSEAEKSAGSAPELTGAFDVQKIHHLVRLMKRYDVTALDIYDGSARIRLKRRGEVQAASPAPVYLPAGVYPGPTAPAAPPQPATPASSPAPPSDAGAAAAAGTTVIESPMVGTYYSSSSPDVPPFVSVGAAVQADSVVCIIEAMKVFTDIPAGVSGTIAEVLVKNGQAVEFGQPLFRVRPA
jgi:acetyl-CoA carboxylase biotin carboxyl carrier protein